MTLEYEEIMEIGNNQKFGNVLSEMFDTYKKRMLTTATVSRKPYRSLALFQPLLVSMTS